VCFEVDLFSQIIKEKIMPVFLFGVFYPHDLDPGTVYGMTFFQDPG
jgi:hypothetical protein